MKVWQLQEAKAKLSELVKLTKKEPQVVSVRGKDEVILLSIKEYNRIVEGSKRELWINYLNHFIN